MLSTTSIPLFIISLNTIRNMAAELERATDMFTSMEQAVMAGYQPFHQTRQEHIQQSQAHQLQQQPSINNNLSASSNAMNPALDMLPHSGPPVPQQQQTSNPLLQQQHQSQNLSSPPRPPVPVPSIKVQRKPRQSSSAASASTPSPAAAATPVASAPTPTAVATFPPAMKSPKGKASGKLKASIGPTKRRLSKAVTVPPQASAEPLESSSPPTSNRSTKRPHDDSTSNGAGPATGSSSTVRNEPPKRPKTERESSPSEALRKKNETIDSIKTEEDAREGQESLASDISDTSKLILKGYGPISGVTSLGEFTPLHPQPSRIYQEQHTPRK